MSQESRPVVPGEEAKFDRSTSIVLSVILMFVFAIGIGLFGAVASDAFRGGYWGGF